MSAKSQHNNILLALLGFIAVVVLVAVIGYFTLDREEEVIQGEVEVSEYRVACKLPGRVTELRVQEGDFVRKGDVLAVLTIPEANAQEKVMEATATATEALSDLAEAPNRKEIITTAYQVYQQALTANEIAQKTYRRLNRLYQEGVISAQKRDEAEAAIQTTTAGVEVARAIRIGTEWGTQRIEACRTKTSPSSALGSRRGEVGIERNRTACHSRWRGFDHLP